MTLFCVIDQDIDGEGFPEAILGQPFVGGDPGAFGYYSYASTSRAAAPVAPLTDGEGVGSSLLN